MTTAFLLYTLARDHHYGFSYKVKQLVLPILGALAFDGVAFGAGYAFATFA